MSRPYDRAALQSVDLFDAHGQRKYLTQSEAKKLLAVARKADRPTRLFCRLLYYTGCRITEGLQTTPRCRGGARHLPHP